MTEFMERAWRWLLRKGRVRRVTLKLNKWSEDLLLIGPRDLNPKFVGKLGAGKDPADLFVGHVRSSVEAKLRSQVRPMLQRLYEAESTKTLGALSFGTFLALDGLQTAAYKYFLEAGVELSKKHATFEFYDAWLTAEPKKAEADLRNALGSGKKKLTNSQQFQLIKAAIKHRVGLNLSPLVYALADSEAVKKTVSADEASELKWWVGMFKNDEVKIKELPNTVNFAVMDYNMLDTQRTSSNRGDYVQTLAALSNLVRFQNVKFVGDGELAPYLTSLQPRVQPDRQVHGLKPVKVQPIQMHRDYSSGRKFPKNTWLISNGWFMHRAYKGEVDFPYAENILPIMISFHIQDAGVMNEKVAAELKKHGPIGCRDWTTVYRLRDYGVPAFFSGCATTTVGQVLPKAKFAGWLPKLAVVEAGRKWMKLRYLFMWKWFYIQIGDHVRAFSLVEGLEDARKMLTKYTKYGKVITKRLHCYLPARSMGLPVEFVPSKRSDVRFEGLLDLNEEQFNKIRNGIENKLEIVIGNILQGKSYAEVMKIWRELVQPDVDFAEAYCTNLEPIKQSTINLPETYKKFKSHVVTLGKNKRGKDAVNIAFACDQNLQNELAVVIASVVRNTKRELNMHVLTRGLGKDYFAKLHKLFPTVNFEFHDFSGIQYGADLNLMKHITVSTFDRLFLPRVLEDLDKVLYLDVDILVRSDVGKLYDLDVRKHVFAGKKSQLDGWANLIDIITRVSLTLPPAKAWALRRRAHATGSLTADTYNAGILLLNLKTMRKENFIEENLYLVEELRLNDQDVMNLYSAGRALQINDDWNFVPTQDYSKNPKIVHWAGPGKPWKKQFALYQGEFNAIAAELKSK